MLWTVSHQLIAFVPALAVLLHNGASAALCGVPVYAPSGSSQPVVDPNSECATAAAVEAVAHSWPWVGSLSHALSPLCGAALVAPGWALTAGQCVADLAGGCRPADFSLTFGLHQEDQQTGPGVVQAEVEEIIAHKTADLALIRLAEPLASSDNVQPVCLPLQDAEPDGSSNAFIARWETEPTLTQLAVPLVRNEFCHFLWTNTTSSEVAQRCRNHYGSCPGYGNGGGTLGSNGGGSLGGDSDSLGLALGGPAATIVNLAATTVTAALLYGTTTSLQNLFGTGGVSPTTASNTLPFLAGDPAASTSPFPAGAGDVLCAGCTAGLNRTAEAGDRLGCGVGMPLVQFDDDTQAFQQIGILSGTGTFDNCETAPSAYTKVSAHVAWILAEMAKPSSGSCTTTA